MHTFPKGISVYVIIFVQDLNLGCRIILTNIYIHIYIYICMYVCVCVCVCVKDSTDQNTLMECDQTKFIFQLPYISVAVLGSHY